MARISKTYNFTLNEEEDQVFCDALNSEIENLLISKMECLINNDNAAPEWVESHIEYMRKLKDKIFSSRASIVTS